jgi:hypothetical protein
MPRSVPRKRYMVAIVFLTFFVMSLLANILGPLVPDIISSFKASLAAAAFLPFSFFICPWSDVDSRWFSGRTLWRKNRHDRGVPGGHGGIIEFRLAPGLSRGGVLAIRNGIGNGYAANRDQSPVAGFGGRSAFRFQFRIRPARLRKRLLFSVCICIRIWS